MRILIGYDGSESSDVVLQDLALAGLPREADVRVVTIADLLMSGPQPREVAAQELSSWRVGTALKQIEIFGDRVVREAREFASRAADMVRLSFPEWNVEREVLTGTPAWELIDAAEKWDADLIAIGSRGRSAVTRLFLGSVSKTVVNDSRRSVRVARPGIRKDRTSPPRIIVGVDGSPASKEAVTAVGRRVWPDDTQVRLVTAHELPSPARIAARLPNAAAMINSFNNDTVARQNATLQWALSQLRSIGLNVSMSIQRGDARRILLKEAEKFSADSIFVGTRDFKHAFERFRLGSVSSGVVTNAPCSVEVVRPREHDYEVSTPAEN